MSAQTAPRRVGPTRVISAPSAGLQLSDLGSGERSLPVTLRNGKVITVTYDPDLLTLGAIAAAGRVEEDPMQLAACLCGLITGWDLMDGVAPIPVGHGHEQRIVMDIPAHVILSILEAVLAENQPDPPSAKR